MLCVFTSPDAAEQGEGGVLLDEGGRTLGEVVKEWQCIQVSLARLTGEVGVLGGFAGLVSGA